MDTEARVAWALELALELKRQHYRTLLIRLVEDIDAHLPLDAIERRIHETVTAGQGGDANP